MIGGEWPSESKRQKLREAGKVPYSRFAIVCLTLAALLLFVPDFNEGWGLFLDRWQAVFRNPAGDAVSVLHQLRDASAGLLRFALAPVLCVLGTALVFGLLQTKFLFNPGLLGVRIERLNPFHGFNPGGILLRAAGALLAGVCSLAIAGLIVRAALPLLLTVLSSRHETGVHWPYLFYGQALPAALMALGTAAAAAWLGARLAFMLRHSMTREELEKEGRERE